VAVAVIYATDAFATARGIYAQLQILTAVIRLAREVHVDPVDVEKLMGGAIDGLLDKLDPHSNYMPPDEAKDLAEKLRGDFGGIGITYSILDGAPTVISTIEGGPAAGAGLLTGDRIVLVDGRTTADWRDTEVRQYLRGAVGTDVDVSLQRAGTPELIEVRITRGTIPLDSVPYSFMLNDSAGYIRIARFARTTGDEVEEALRDLLSKRMRYLIIDLRGNGGGDLDAAVRVSDYFLREGSVVVSQRGRWAAANKSHDATDGELEIDVPVVVMINRGSASASEIVSGALQDTDRAIILGQRSFGKGLVQRPFDLSRKVSGGGVLLLTVARYYTPTGRLIQRDYSDGVAQYVLEARHGSNEAERDSTEGPAFLTPLGRTVYGGGGIQPDRETTPPAMNATVARLARKAAFFRFADRLVQNGVAFGDDLESFERDYVLNAQTWDEFVEFACQADSGLNRDRMSGDRAAVAPLVRAGIAGRVWGREARYRLTILMDSEIVTAGSQLMHAAYLLESAAAKRSE